MASHHHHCHPPATTSCCCCHYSTFCTPPQPDPHLQSVQSHLHHHHPPPPQPHPYSPHLNPPHESLHHHHQTPYYPSPTYQQIQPEFQHQQQQPAEPTVSSLLRRIAALESSLRRQYSANSALRDAAARTIQTHFRAFLVRRSRTLRQLKDLASIKSTLNTLKSSSIDNAHLDSQVIHRRAMNLLLKLDSIQSGDPMIRDGKRSISRDIIRFVEFIDGVFVERNEISRLALRNLRFGKTGNKSRVLQSGHKIGPDERVLVEKLRGRVEKLHAMVSEHDDEEEGIELENPRTSINGKLGSCHNRNGVQSKVKKSVSFADNGNISRVFSTTHEPNSSGDTNSSDGSGSVEEERELVDNICSEVDKIRLSEGNEDEEEARIEDGGSPNVIDGERNNRRDLRDEDSYEMSADYEEENGEFVFSAPLPVKMESRADLMKKRGAVKIVN